MTKFYKTLGAKLSFTGTLNPLSLFREAIKEYPAVKPLFGLLAAVALLLVVLSTRISTSYAVFGVVIVLGFLVLLALAVGATRLPATQIALPIIVLIWAVLILSIASMSLLFTGYFFNWPLPIRPVASTAPLHPSTEQPPSVLSVISPKYSPTPEPSPASVQSNLTPKSDEPFSRQRQLSPDQFRRVVTEAAKLKPTLSVIAMTIAPGDNEAWSLRKNLADAFTRAGIRVSISDQQPEGPDQIGIMVETADPDRPDDVARALRNVLESVGFPSKYTRKPQSITENYALFVGPKPL